MCVVATDTQTTPLDVFEVHMHYVHAQCCMYDSCMLQMGILDYKG